MLSTSADLDWNPPTRILCCCFTVSLCRARFIAFLRVNFESSWNFSERSQFRSPTTMWSRISFSFNVPKLQCLSRPYRSVIKLSTDLPSRLFLKLNFVCLKTTFFLRRNGFQISLSPPCSSFILWWVQTRWIYCLLARPSCKSMCLLDSCRFACPVALQNLSNICIHFGLSSGLNEDLSRGDTWEFATGQYLPRLLAIVPKEVVVVWRPLPRRENNKLENICVKSVYMYVWPLDTFCVTQKCLTYWNQARNSSYMYRSTAMFYSLTMTSVRMHNKITNAWQLNAGSKVW